MCLLRGVVRLMTLCRALTACAAPAQAPASREAVTFTDDLGRVRTEAGWRYYCEAGKS